jgi:hypothetical protein
MGNQINNKKNCILLFNPCQSYKTIDKHDINQQLSNRLHDIYNIKYSPIQQ